MVGQAAKADPGVAPVGGSRPLPQAGSSIVAPSRLYAASVDVGELDRLVEASDWQGLRDLLTAMPPTEATAAGTWYRRTGRSHARRVADRDWREESRAVQLFLALTLSADPNEASRNCRWGQRFLSNDNERAATTCAERLVGRGPDWAAAFVQSATTTTLRGAGRRGLGELVSVTSAAVAGHELDTPLTETYVLGWTSLLRSAHLYARSTRARNWTPLALLTVTSGAVGPAYALDESLTLGDCLAGTRSATALLDAALATPDALQEWAAFTEQGWRVEPAVREAVGSGVLDREPLLRGALRALSRADRVTNQKVIAEVLKGLDPTPEEIRENVALVLHVLPTAHGSVTKTLLGMALDAGLADEDLVEFGTVILARPEKAQKTTLVAKLATTNGGAREPLLTMAAASDDAALAAKARALLGQPECTESTPAPTAGITALPAWSHTVEPFRSGPFQPYAASDVGLDQAGSDVATWSRITTEAAYLDLVVRFAHRDLDRLRSLVAAAAGPGEYGLVRTPYLLHQWATTGVGRRSYVHTTTSYRHDRPGGDPIVERHTYEFRPPPTLLFTDRLVEETLARLGPLDELLSTPSRADGTLEVAVLADRVRRARDVGYGPYDLVQALLRLGPTSPDDVRRFTGTTLAPIGETAPGRSWFARRRAVAGERDGVEVIRSWIAAGGWSPRQVDFPTLEPGTSGLTLPLPHWLAELDGVDGLCQPTEAGDTSWRRWGADEPGPSLGVCPWDVENLATMMAGGADPNSVLHAQKLPIVVWSAGPIGPGVHHHVARLLTHPRLDSRLLAAEHAATLAEQGRLDPELLRERSLALFAHGELALARAAHGWAELAALSSWSVVWPAWLAVLDAACAADKKPAGLADLLRSTRDYAALVVSVAQDGWVPESVRSLAAEPGAAKAVVEAQALLEAIDSLARSSLGGDGDAGALGDHGGLGADAGHGADAGPGARQGGIPR